MFRLPANCLLFARRLVARRLLDCRSARFVAVFEPPGRWSPGNWFAGPVLLIALAALFSWLVFPSSSSHACNTSPCDATCAVLCRVEGVTHVIDVAEDFTVSVEVEITNATEPSSCSGEVPLDIEVSVLQTGAFGDATEIELIVDDTVGVQTTLAPTLNVTFPADSEVGNRTFTIEVTAEDPDGLTCTRFAALSIFLTDVVEIRDVSPYSCGIAGDPSMKTFRITNNTDVERTIEYTITSNQQSTLPPTGEGDHFPLATLGEILGHGDPKAATPPEVTGIATVPAGIGSSVDVTFLTASFPACHAGSQCTYTLTGVDDETGSEIGGCTAHTVVTDDWEGCEFVECQEELFCESAVVTINDDVVAESLLEIMATFLIDDIDVSVAITHPDPAEFVMELESPAGTIITLFEPNAPTLDADLIVEFDDDGEPTLVDPIIQPTGPGLLSDFTAETTAGFWRLRVEDAVDGNDGTIDEWCLDLSCPRRLIGFSRGDANGDGIVFGLLDSLFLLNYLFVIGSPEPTCFDGADVDDNGVVTILDPLYLLNFAFNGGDAPPAPVPGECGTDPDGTADGIDCATPSC